MPLVGAHAAALQRAAVHRLREHMCMHVCVFTFAFVCARACMSVFVYVYDNCVLAVLGALCVVQSFCV